MTRAAVSLTTGLEDPEKVTVALLVAVGAAEGGRDALMFLTKEAVRLATEGFALGTACDGCPPIDELMRKFQAEKSSFAVAVDEFGGVTGIVTAEDVVEEVHVTVVHEIAHHFGIDDDRLHELGYD